MKPIHRMILLSNNIPASRTCRNLSAKAMRTGSAEQAALAIQRRRLQAEELRDAMMVASGLFNPKRFGPSVIVPIESELVNLLYKPWSVGCRSGSSRAQSTKHLSVPQAQLACAVHGSLRCSGHAAELCAAREQHACAASFGTAERICNAAGFCSAGGSIEARSRAVRPAARSTLPSISCLAESQITKERETSLRFLKKNPTREFTLALFAPMISLCSITTRSQHGTGASS